MAEFPKKLQDRLDARHRDGNFRELPVPEGRIDFTSNDYLGFARLPLQPMGPASGRGLRGSTGSRLLSGNHPFYQQAEARVAHYHRAGAALIYNSGYDANLGLLSAILQRTDYVFYDSGAHASIRDGISLGHARSYKYQHNSLESLRETVGRVLGQLRPADAEVYVVTESVFSMEGDGPDLLALSAYCRENGFRLVLDEAHAVGVLGPGGKGAAVELGIEGALFARVVTFGKALGCHGAAVLGSPDLKAYLVNFSRSLIYTTALPPHSLEGILQAYDLLAGSEGIKAMEALGRRLRCFEQEVGKAGLGHLFPPARGAIFSCRLGGNQRTRALAETLQEAGYEVRPIFSPTVPEGQECLRFCVHSYNAPEEIQDVLSILGRKLRDG